jgi:hypothetical protein
MPCHNAVMTPKSEFSESPEIDRNRSKTLRIDHASHSNEFQIDVRVFRLLLKCTQFLWPQSIREYWTALYFSCVVYTYGLWWEHTVKHWTPVLLKPLLWSFFRGKMVRNKMVRNFVVRNKLALYLVGRSKLVRDLLMPGVSRFEILHSRKVVTAKI